MGLSEEMTYCFTYSDMLEGLPAFITVCEKRDIKIPQQRAEKAARNRGGGTSFAPSPKPPALPKHPAGATAGTGAGYTRPAPIDLSSRQKDDFCG